MLGGGGGERRYLTFSPSLLRGCPRCIKWRVSWAQEGHGGSNNSQKWKAQCQTYLGRLGSLCKILGWVLDLQSFLPSWPHPPLTPRGASVLNPTLWTAENWTCSTSQGEPEAKQSLKPTSPELPVKRGASCISFHSIISPLSQVWLLPAHASSLPWGKGQRKGDFFFVVLEHNTSVSIWLCWSQHGNRQPDMALNGDLCGKRCFPKASDHGGGFRGCDSERKCLIWDFGGSSSYSE